MLLFLLQDDEHELSSKMKKGGFLGGSMVLCGDEKDWKRVSKKEWLSIELVHFASFSCMIVLLCVHFTLVLVHA